jgi:ribonuclease VapC
VIVDSSSLVAILRDEPGADLLMDALSRAPQPRISAGTLLETSIVVDAQGDPVLSARLDQLLAAAGLVVEDVTEEHYRVARQAYRDYGRGSGHSAALNFGDCFAYALAKVADEPLLFTGTDFSRTDLRAALP